jgi:hypothetical protein
MGRQRILVDIETVGQARKIEETVKSGYLEATIEHLLQWIAVEEDLISSYDQLSGRKGGGREAALFAGFSKNSGENLKQLNGFLKSCESMALERQKRLEALATLEHPVAE